MAKENEIQFWQGLEAARSGVTPTEGEPLWTTDNKQLFIGDGTTAGGIRVAMYSELPTQFDLDFQADSGGALSITNAETLTFSGGTGIDTVGSGNDVTFNLNVDGLTTSGGLDDTDELIVDDVTNGVRKTTLSALKSYINAAAGTFSNFTIAGDTGSGQVDDTETVTIIGGEGIVTSWAANVSNHEVTVDLSITELDPATALQSTDSFAIYDVSEANHGEATMTQLQTYMQNNLSFADPGAPDISGTPVNNQIAVWVDADTLEGDVALTFDTASNLLGVGTDDTATGIVSIFGNSTTGGGTLNIYNGATVDTSTYFWRLASDASGDLVMTAEGASPTTIFTVDETTNVLSFNAGNNPQIGANDILHEGDIGTGAGQVAAGDHDHTGVYEPADAAICHTDESETVTAGWTFSTTATTFASNIKLNDNVNLDFGTGNDVSFFFNATNLITDLHNNGHWYIRNNEQTVNILDVDEANERVVAQELVVTGDLTVNGTTTTVNSTTVTVDDPIFTLGGDTAPVSDDNKDRGIEFRWHNGTSAKVGFFGFDDSTGKLTFIPDGTNTSEVFSGTIGEIDAEIDWTNVINAPAFLTAEVDTLETVTGRGASSTNAISITNATNATSSSTGALIVTGGIGVGNDIFGAGAATSKVEGFALHGGTF